MYMYMYTHDVPLPLSDDETLLSSSDLVILSNSFPSEPLPLPPLAPPTAVVPPAASEREGLPDSVVLLEEGTIKRNACITLLISVSFNTSNVHVHV